MLDVDVALVAGQQQPHRIAVARHQPFAVLVEHDQGVVERLLDRHAAMQAQRVAAFGKSHFAFDLCRSLPSSVESSTPVHSALETSPCSAWAVTCNGSLENIGAELPVHSRKCRARHHRIAR